MIFELAGDPSNRKFFVSALNAMRDDCEMKIEHFRGDLYINMFYSVAGPRFDLAGFNPENPIKRIFESANDVAGFLLENSYGKFHWLISC